MESHDEGLARNIMRLAGCGDLFADLAGRRLQSVALSDDQELVVFSFEDGAPAVFRVEGDCCSHSWVEHLEAPASVAGRILVDVDDLRTGQEETGDGLRQSYQTRFALDNGESITIEYRNDSNGYYGGYLLRVRQ